MFIVKVKYWISSSKAVVQVDRPANEGTVFADSKAIKNHKGKLSHIFGH